jgi:hypothetical protein
MTAIMPQPMGSGKQPAKFNAQAAAVAFSYFPRNGMIHTAMLEHAVGVGLDDRLQPKKRKQPAIEFAGAFAEKYARCR